MWAVSSTPLLRDLPFMVSAVQDIIGILFESDTVSSNLRKKMIIPFIRRMFFSKNESLGNSNG